MSLQTPSSPISPFLSHDSNLYIYRTLSYGESLPTVQIGWLDAVPLSPGEAMPRPGLGGTNGASRVLPIGRVERPCAAGNTSWPGNPEPSGRAFPEGLSPSSLGAGSLAGSPRVDPVSAGLPADHLHHTLRLARLGSVQDLPIQHAGATPMWLPIASLPVRKYREALDPCGLVLP